MTTFRSLVDWARETGAAVKYADVAKLVKQLDIVDEAWIPGPLPVPVKILTMELWGLERSWPGRESKGWCRIRPIFGSGSFTVRVRPSEAQDYSHFKVVQTETWVNP